MDTVLVEVTNSSGGPFPPFDGDTMTILSLTVTIGGFGIMVVVVILITRSRSVDGGQAEWIYG
jgi:hypothetical protein